MRSAPHRVCNRKRRREGQAAPVCCLTWRVLLIWVKGLCAVGFYRGHGLDSKAWQKLAAPIQCAAH